ncbi:hypothetical protein AKG07_08850 [Microbacterium sp. CGR1]|uniref:hypothetical protein n=1 Tax=Microbacterium sp. CGR1 TaxID=1696072 RepID=UPI00069F73C9|nr:hypothetical protein [Microbacterium sp. CGR1]AKV86392.1 hypothetical protein AKG07_08850 [Microbacterium sp. CGR1]
MNEWSIVLDVARLLVAAGIGIGSAQLALHFERRRVDRAADADWTLTPVAEQVAKRSKVRAWVLKNAGTRTATDVALNVTGSELIRDPDSADLFRPGEAEMIFLDQLPSGSLKLRISWTNHRGEQRETTRLLEIVY